MKQSYFAVPDHPTMPELFMKYPIGTTVNGQEIKGYRQIQKESALIFTDASRHQPSPFLADKTPK